MASPPCLPWRISCVRSGIALALRPAQPCSGCRAPPETRVSRMIPRRQEIRSEPPPPLSQHSLPCLRGTLHKPQPSACEHLACCCMPNQHGSELILPVCAGFRNSGAPSCARQEKSGAQPLRAQAPAPFSSQCPLARCTCRRCFECLAGWLTWRLDRRQRGLETKSPSREGDFFQVEVAHFNAPGEHSR